MSRYGQFCPVAKAAEIFAERWTPLIVRELFCGSRRFNELEQGLPRIPRSLLVQRLRSLERAGVIARRANFDKRVNEYHLTEAGTELAQVVVGLGEWGQRWVNSEVRPEDVDLDVLIWDLHRRIHVDRMPQGRTVVQFDFYGVQNRSYWLVVQHGEASVCRGDPGFEVDLQVIADALAFHRVWIGHRSMDEALRREEVVLEGPTEMVRAFPRWLAYSMFASIRPAAKAA